MIVSTADGVRLQVADSGGTGPAVLFLHGNLMDHTMWDAVVQAMSGYRCIRFDFRLHGATVDDGLPFTYWDAARDALAVLDRCDVPAAHVVGHSQGGFTALRAALLAPRRVRTLTLLDTAATAFPAEALREMAGSGTASPQGRSNRPHPPCSACCWAPTGPASSTGRRDCGGSRIGG
jgi:pimeloyl-ACP methyl ester carboxylesterase